MTDTRPCEQCGSEFTPRREHARFCSARCRLACHGENPGDRAAEMSALNWSVAAMWEATGRLARVRAWDRARAAWAVADAVWWVTIVDATLVRYYPEDYDSVLGGLAAAERRVVEDTLAGLRFVRNQIGSAVDQVDFIGPGAGHLDPAERGITAWTWKSVPKPALASLPPRGQAWELTRYRAYQAQLAGHAIGDTFGQAAAFLNLAVAKAASVTEVLADAVR